MDTLEKIYERNRVGLFPDRNTTHSYIPVYEKILASYRETAKDILEIGILGGQSLLMWEQYFTGTVHGADCSETPLEGKFDLRPMIAEGTHHIHIMDATTSIDIKREFEGVKFDVVIDDGSHALEAQIASYLALKPYMEKGSIYIIEDIQNIDLYRENFERIDDKKNVEIIDRRSIKGRYDDVLVVITDK